MCDHVPLPATTAAGNNTPVTAPQTLPVLLVDDHAMLRQGLRSVLEGHPDVQVVGEASDGHEAVVMVQQLQPASAQWH